MRYDQLRLAVLEKQPRAILEVGTWNGARALEMLTLSPGAKYYGFDLFEEGSPTTDREEMNRKTHYYCDLVREKLKSFDAQLHKGNTKVTLRDFSEKVDFVWLDGGHSVETIRSDWGNIKRCLTPDAWVFFDDYYTGSIDTELYGCNKIVEDLEHEVMPHKDKVTGGGFVQMVRVFP